MKIHVTFPIFENARQMLADAGIEYTIFEGELPQSSESLRANIAGCSGLICSLFDRIDAEFFDAIKTGAGGLKVIAQFGVGYDNIDVSEAEKHGVIVTNTPGVLTEATAEMAITLMLAAARRLGEGERMVRAGGWTGWEPGQMLGQGVVGKTMGIVGAGRIGQETARMAHGLRMSILYTSRDPKPAFEAETGAVRVELDELLERSDVVSINVALNDATRHLIGVDELARMKPTAVLVNTARGAVVDEAALVEVLREGRIAAAGLDVYEREPELSEGLAALPNVVLAPHLVSATREVREKMAELATRNLIAVLNGTEPPNPIRS